VDSSRPSDHFDQEAAPQREGIIQPQLGFVGTLRFFWRQLTSMRTALFLLLLLAIAAIPGSLVPQVTSDPNGVIQYKAQYPELSAVLDALGVFSTYSSVWFSAIYLLLFISLIGCVVPRTKHHFEALLAKPPKTPARLERLPGFTSTARTVDAALAVSTAQALLKRQGYRAEVYGESVSAERGYLRETGNLVFHTALIGVLVTVGLGGGFGFTGQKIVVEGSAFVNVLGNYDSFNPGRFVDGSNLTPYRILLDDFDVRYEEENFAGYGQPIDFTATVSTTEGDRTAEATIKVNEPLHIGGTEVYLLGNGYAPVMTVRDAAGEIVTSQPVPCIPQDAQLFSVCVLKVPDGLEEQVAFRGLLYPTTGQLDNGALTSVHPDLLDPTLSLEVYAGDLGLDDGIAVGVYTLDTSSLTEIAGRTAAEPTIELKLGDRVDLPNGLGSVELTEIPRFVSLEIHRDPAQGWVLGFAIAAVLGLLTSLFIPRRRVWVKVAGDRIEYAGLARGEDPTLDAAVADLAEKHRRSLADRA
jgi:cytochrome c biogenesis protein